MTHQRPFSFLLLSLILTVLQASPARAQEDAVRSFQTIAERVLTEFRTATDGVKHVRVDVRRRDTLPGADVRMVGMLRFDLKPKDGPAWHSVRFLFGYRDGQWRLLKIFDEVPSEHPTSTDGGPWYWAVVEKALESAQ